jgi:hypothetical protein
MADFAASAGMELFHVGKFGIFGTRTPPFLTGSGRVSGWYKSPFATAPNLPGLGVDSTLLNLPGLNSVT